MAGSSSLYFSSVTMSIASSVLDLSASRHLPPATSTSSNRVVIDSSDGERSGSVVAAVEDLSVFDLLNIFRHRYYVSRDVLASHVTEASKDAFGFFDWVVLDKDYHSKVITKFIWIVGEGRRFPPSFVEKIKKVMFVFLLGVLNGAAAEDFFALKKGETLENRTRQEVKRQARKRARAAKRERVRTAKLDQKAAKGKESCKQARKFCRACSQMFETRNARRKHECFSGLKKCSPKKGEVVVMASKPIDSPVDTAPSPLVTVPSEDRVSLAATSCAFVYASSDKPCRLQGPESTMISCVSFSGREASLYVCKAHASSMTDDALMRSLEYIEG
ncbi:hypothetical protein BJY52DRAFT_1365257 [Lactarius psammicola]|nr:hypothetical protein BJY52DRAFT_1365257 [Lactarius psammicola]